MLSTEVGVLLVSKVVEFVDEHRIEQLNEEKTEQITPIVALDYGFMTLKMQRTLPLLICRD